MLITEIGEKIIRQTVKTRGGGELLLLVRYPVIANTVHDGARLKRSCESLNTFFHRVAEKYIACAKKASSGTSCELSYRVSSIDEHLVSVYFEAVRRDGREIISHRPFAATFSPRDGVMRPITDAFPGAAERFRASRAYFAAQGIHLSKRDYMRNYYLTCDTCVVFAPRPTAGHKYRRAGDCVVKYTL